MYQTRFATFIRELDGTLSPSLSLSVPAVNQCHCFPHMHPAAPLSRTGMLLSTNQEHDTVPYGGSSCGSSTKRFRRTSSCPTSTTSTSSTQPQHGRNIAHDQFSDTASNPHGAMTQATTPHVAPSAAAAALSFPQAKFAAGRRIVDKSGAFYTLVSQATGRCWRAIDSVRECQFGEVLRAVEIRKSPSSGKWEHATVASRPTFFAIKVGAM